MSSDERYTNDYRVLSLFAGIGGLDLGLEAHGCTTVAYSEVDPYASAVMAQHFPDAINLGDITTIGWENVAREHGPFDIICGGFPCQDISLAGKGAGMDGARSGLWTNYADAIRVLRPRGVLVENVSALLARGIDRVLGDLAAIGFDAEWDCVPAAALGAPHLRDRVFLIAYGTDNRDRERPTVAADAASEQGRWILERGIQSDAHAGARDRGAPGDVVDERRPAHDAVRRRYRASQGQVRAGWDRPVGSDRWRVEPEVGRVVDGFPDRVDQLKCLGNAVVPQVSEHVAGILIDRIEAA